MNILSILAAIIYFVLFLFTYRKKWHLAFYLMGTVGVVLVVLLVFKVFTLEYIFQILLLNHTHILSSLVGFKTEVLQVGTLMINSRFDATITQVGIECSAILEMSVMAGLILFYPLFRTSEKILLSIIGCISIYALNLLRLLLIVACTSWGGHSWTVFAHFFLGKLLFFAGIIVLFWFIITKPTLRWVHDIYTTHNGLWTKRVGTILDESEEGTKNV